MAADFIHLRVHSAYSLAEGAIKIPKLIETCVEYGMPAVAVTDTNNMFSMMEFSIYSAKAGLQPIVGMQISIIRPEDEGGDISEDPDQLVMLAQNKAGYMNMMKLVSKSHMATSGAEPPHITWSDIEQYNDGIICLTGGPKGSIGRQLAEGNKDAAAKTAARLKSYFGDRLYIELLRHGTVDEIQIEDGFLDIAYDQDIPIVATNNCYFPERKMYEAHDALLCIAGGNYVTEDRRRKVTPEHYLKSPEEMKQLFHDLPEAIENTVEIAKRCSYFLEVVDPILPRFETSEGRTEVEELKYEAEEGLKWRLENYVYTEKTTEEEKIEIAKPYWERLEYELGILIQMGFAGYFLIVADFIQWAKDQDIPVGPGRGSGAGSLVAYAMKITDLDPIDLQLLFERFLNPERVSMPDFDIDFCQTRREEVIEYVQRKYGEDRVAQIITFGKLQARNTVRDVGRVLQLSYGQVDRIAKLVPSNPANPISLQEAIDTEPDLRDAIRSDENVQKLIEIALQLEGLYRHASTHAAGVVIGDRPLDELVPLYRDPNSPMPVTQFNMKFVEQASLVKFDFLGLKTTSVIKKAIDFIDETEDIQLDPLEFPLDDKPTLDMLARGENAGVFQLESAGFQDLCRKIGIKNFEEIIATVALYRPGPMENIPQYLACIHGEQEQDFMHPSLETILRPTYGVMIYQEQVMQVAQTLSGYSLGGADLLRRAMGKKIKEEMDKQRILFVDGAVENDVDGDQAGLIFDQVAKFAGYGFNKSHSACYAFIAYQTAYLKRHYPVEFMAASMTYDMGNTDKLAFFRNELRRMDITLLLPDINKSLPFFSVERLPNGEKAVRYALGALKGVGEEAMRALVKERDENGAYKDLFDLAQRLDSKIMNKRQMEALTTAGALECLNPNRAETFASIETLLKYASTLAEEAASGQNSLFGEDTAVLERPALPQKSDWDALEKLQREFASVGFYLSAHPLDTMQTQLERMKVVSSGDVAQRLAEQPNNRMRLGGVVLAKQERISAKGNKFAFINLSDSQGSYEGIMFSDTIDACRELLIVGKSVLVTADVEKQDEEIRYLFNNVECLEEAVNKASQAVHVVMDDARAVPHLKEALKDKHKGRMKLHIFVKTNEGEYADIELPGYFQIDPEDRKAIRQISGISEAKEV